MSSTFELRMQLICNTLEYTIENQKNELSPTATFYINNFIKEIDDLILSIDSINEDRTSSQANISTAFYFSPNLTEVIELSGVNKATIEKEKLIQFKKFLITKKTQTKELLENPNTFYESKKASTDLLDFVKSISTIYDSEYHVLTHLQSVV